MSKKKIELAKKPILIKNMAIGYDEDIFLLGFNCNKDEVPEESYIIPAERLKDIVGILFEAGTMFQKETNVDIGFGIGEDNDDGE